MDRSTAIERSRTVEGGGDGVLGLPAGFPSDQEPHLADLLPLAIERKQAADLEVSGRDVDGVADLAPLAEVLQCLSVLVGVVDN